MCLKYVIDPFSSFILAMNIYQQSDPAPPPKYDYKGKDMTLWDRIEIREGDITLKQLVDVIEEREEIEVDMIGIGSALIYFTWMAPAKRKERMGKKLSGIFIFIIIFLFFLFSYFSFNFS